MLILIAFIAAVTFIRAFENGKDEEPKIEGVSSSAVSETPIF
jgi:hypothetical protein